MRKDVNYQRHFRIEKIEKIQMYVNVAELSSARKGLTLKQQDIFISNCNFIC